MFFFPGEEFEYIDPADEEMDDGFVFSPVSVTGLIFSGSFFLRQKISLTLNRVFDKKVHLNVHSLWVHLLFHAALKVNTIFYLCMA